MRRFTALLLGILPLMTFANPQADTIGMKISHTFRTIETTVYVKQSIDSIVSLDLPKVTTVTYDTLKGTERTETIDTTYFITQPLKFWKLESRLNAAITQINRWNRKGEGNMFSIQLSNNSIANYARGLSTWKTELDWVYAGDKQEGADWFKAQDRFNIVSRYGFRASSTWSYSGLFEFNTQLSKSYNRGTNNKDAYVSRFLSPARSTFSLGMAYTNNLSNLTAPNAANPMLVDLLLSPVTYRATYMSDTSLNRNFSVPVGEHWLSEFGFSLRLDSRHRLTNDIILRSRLNLMANLLEMGEPFITVDWRVNFDIRLYRHFTLGLETWLLYDPTELFPKVDSNGDVIGRVRKTQFQQSLMLRFTYRITN